MGSSWAQLGPPSSGFAATERDRFANMERQQQEEEIKRQFDLIFRAPTGESPDGGGMIDRVQRWNDAIRQVAANTGSTEERVGDAIRGRSREVSGEISPRSVQTPRSVKVGGVMTPPRVKTQGGGVPAGKRAHNNNIPKLRPAEVVSKAGSRSGAMSGAGKPRSPSGMSGVETDLGSDCSESVSVIDIASEATWCETRRMMSGRRVDVRMAMVTIPRTKTMTGARCCAIGSASW